MTILNKENFFIIFYFRQRIPRTNVYYYKSPEHSNNYVLSFAFAFDKDGEKYQFALSYPYTYSRFTNFLNGKQIIMDYMLRCQAFLDQISTTEGGLLTRETLIKTIVSIYC